MAGVFQWSVLGYYGTIIALATLCTLPLALLRWTRWLPPFLAWCWLGYLAIDIATFNLYQFHVNWVIVEMFLLDFRGLGIPPQILAIFFGVGATLAAVVILFYRAAKRIPRRPALIGLAVLPTLGIPLLAAHLVISIWANFYAREEITQYSPYFPVYWPTVSNKHAPSISAAWPSIFPAVAGETTVGEASRQGIVRYPLKPPDCAPDQKPSILLITVESWQASRLTPEIMPNLWKFSQSASRFEQHVSSGSSTVPGLFGLLYGLHPTYYELLKASPNSFPSVFTETLDKLGYRSRVFTSGDLDRFALRKLFFSRVSAADYVSDYRDAKLVDAYLATLDGTGQPTPSFDFLFLTSSHSPYLFPPEYARFQPLPKVSGGYALDKMTDATPYKNQYHNSLAYIDAQLGRIFGHPEWQRRLANTWVVITGDHAEEFNENGVGHWGHGSNFSRWQTQTALVVHAPGRRPAVESRLTLHQDVVPTLMQDALGCAGPAGDYANGANLFQPPEQRGTVLSSYFASAYLVGGTVIDRTTGKKYAWDDVKQARKLDDPQAVRRLIEEERRFMAAN